MMFVTCVCVRAQPLALCVRSGLVECLRKYSRGTEGPVVGVHLGAKVVGDPAVEHEENVCVRLGELSCSQTPFLALRKRRAPLRLSFEKWWDLHVICVVRCTFDVGTNNGEHPADWREVAHVAQKLVVRLQRVPILHRCRSATCR